MRTKSSKWMCAMVRLSSGDQRGQESLKGQQEVGVVTHPCVREFAPLQMSCPLACTRERTVVPSGGR
jgi:hypothetical protein